MTSRARQRDQAATLAAGFGQIVAEFFDVGWSRVLPWARRHGRGAHTGEIAPASCALFLARMRVRARRSASAPWGEGARDRVAIGVRFGLREVAGCAGVTREDGGFGAECGDPRAPQQRVP